MCLHDRLSAATKAGKLNEALALVNNHPINQVQECMLRAGFSTGGISNKKEFWQEVQANITEACQARTDGFGLRAKHA